jgi:hypothetical protein
VSAGWTLSQNDGDGQRLYMLCGRFFIGSPHDRLIRDYLPTNLVVRAAAAGSAKHRRASKTFKQSQPRPDLGCVHAVP